MSRIKRQTTQHKHRANWLGGHGAASELLLRGLLDAITDAIITIDPRGIIQSANAGAQRQFGYKLKEMAGSNVKMLMGEPYSSEHDGYIHNYCRTGVAKIIGIGREVTGRRKDGSTFPMHLTVSEIPLGDQRLFTGIVHDLTGRRRLERQIMEAAANEQRRIGQDLHDGLCQDLVGIAFGLDHVWRNIESDDQKDSIRKLSEAVREAAGQARLLAHGLNPVDLKAGGLSVALENLAHKVSESFHIDCAFQWDGRSLVRDDVTATHLYRIAQESVGNSIRHGKASRVLISLSEVDGCVALSIRDNGKGMPKTVLSRIRQGLAVSGDRDQNEMLLAGMGLRTMQYRAGVIGGTFLLSPAPGHGTIVTCRLGAEQRAGRGRRSTPNPRARRRTRASGNIRADERSVSR